MVQSQVSQVALVDGILSKTKRKPESASVDEARTSLSGSTPQEETLTANIEGEKGRAVKKRGSRKEKGAWRTTKRLARYMDATPLIPLISDTLRFMFPPVKYTTQCCVTIGFGQREIQIDKLHKEAQNRLHVAVDTKSR
ncbi:hypothetical protein ACRALDRAFT_209603 [Sodiomyces alcalophilus JCM 7366]|uniref:uncharacterized protein n=1 Tax=Sodiomyces alcalophilus JCM 7366 TaxID=591952 RepID=UPI0039B61907